MDQDAQAPGQIGEIRSLRVADVRQEDGVSYFQVTEHDGGTIKSEAALRRVPVHRQLERVGFREYLRHVQRDGHEFLFPGLRPGGRDRRRGAQFTKRFTTYRRECGVTRERVAFHSFRKNVVEALERARVHQSEVAQLVGHERGFTFSVYSPLGLDMKSLKKVVERIGYRGLKLRHLNGPSP